MKLVRLDSIQKKSRILHSNKMSFELKKDKYFRAREGFGKFIELSCTACQEKTLVYQKDGSGSLFRCYLNRIFWPDTYANLQYDSDIVDQRDMPNFSCISCDSIIGLPMRHVDDRLAYRLIRGRFSKKNHTS